MNDQELVTRLDRIVARLRSEKELDINSLVKEIIKEESQKDEIDYLFMDMLSDYNTIRKMISESIKEDEFYLSLGRLILKHLEYLVNIQSYNLRVISAFAKQIAE